MKEDLVHNDDLDLNMKNVSWLTTALTLLAWLAAEQVLLQ